MKTPVNQSRRNFIKLSITSSGGLALGFILPGCVDADTSVNTETFSPNAWLTIETDGQITIILTQSEMGQGVMTSMPVLVAEELDADWNKIIVKQAPVDPVYGWQGTGGSKSVRNGWDQLRKAGASARTMLVAAAAKIWGISQDSCQTKDSHVINLVTGVKLSYAELVPHAVKESYPDNARLKDPENFRFIGQSIPRIDIPAKVTGNAKFGIDVSIPNLQYATVVHCPVFSGKPVSIDKSIMTEIPEVKHLIMLDNAVGVIATDFWSALKASKKINIEWDSGILTSVNSSTIHKSFSSARNQRGKIHRDDGDIDDIDKSGNDSLHSVYETAYQAHATMEPMCCTAYVSDGKCEIWAPTQQPTGAFKTVKKLTGFADENIKINTTLLGGGFGRRNLQDFVVQAVQLSMKTGMPIKLIWSREEDIQHDFYNPATYHELSAQLGANNLPEYWHHKLIGTDYSAGALDLPYEIPNMRMESVNVRTGIPPGPWRSVSYSFNVFATECFIDELAKKAGADPVEFRLEMLNKVPRLKNVLKIAANKALWGKNSRQGIYQGAAVTSSFGSFVAQIADISMKNKKIKVEKVTCVVDCGTVINPDTVKAQIEGAIVYGLSATLKSKITIKEGRVEQSNFHDFPILRYDEMPEVEVHIVDSELLPGGIGEPGLPPIAPAVANAYFKATGKRLKQLPLIS